MKLLLVSFISLSAISTMAGIKPNRTPIYNCVNYDRSKNVEGAVIYKSQMGRGPVFYEIKVEVVKLGKRSFYTKKVNLLSKYEGRIQEYTTGNFRIKIDRVRKNDDGHFAAFARMPKHNIHAWDWSCKDY